MVSLAIVHHQPMRMVSSTLVPLVFACPHPWECPHLLLFCDELPSLLPCALNHLMESTRTGELRAKSQGDTSSTATSNVTSSGDKAFEEISKGIWQDCSIDKGACCQAWPLEFDFKIPHGYRRTSFQKLSPDLHTHAVTQVCMHTCVHACIYKHAINVKHLYH